MTGEDDGDAHTLGLLVDMRELCTRIAEEHHGYAAQLHDLVRQIQNPNVHGLDKELTHRVEHLDGKTALEQWPEAYRILSANCSSPLARAAFEVACKRYPNQRLILKWGSHVIETHEPKP